MGSDQHDVTLSRALLHCTRNRRAPTSRIKSARGDPNGGKYTPKPSSTASAAIAASAITPLRFGFIHTNTRSYDGQKCASASYATGTAGASPQSCSSR